MNYSFPRYLRAKQTVDDRALNREVYATLKAHLPPGAFTVIEVGAGIGAMLARLVRWGILRRGEYLALDDSDESIAYAQTWLPQWAAEQGLRVDNRGEGGWRVFDDARDLQIKFLHADVFDFARTQPAPADVLIAHAVLDLWPLPASLPPLLALTKNLAWLTINFDGMTTFAPTLDAELDATIERLYHGTMDTRPSGGDSQCGRHLFGHLQTLDATILAAGASDWVVYPVNGKYCADEQYFLHFILHFVEESLTGHPALDPALFSPWLATRRRQIEQGELVYIAHQLDFLVKP
jgi:hypothetical protein